jgi:hypothetical protein
LFVLLFFTSNAIFNLQASVSLRANACYGFFHKLQSKTYLIIVDS